MDTIHRIRLFTLSSHFLQYHPISDGQTQKDAIIMCLHIFSLKEKYKIPHINLKFPTFNIVLLQHIFDKSFTF